MSITICNKLFNIDTTEVDLIDSNLTEIPMEIFMLNNLEHLYLQENRIKTIPKEIGVLKKLKTLNFEQNLITTIPVEISMLKNLEYLNMGNNHLTSVPDEIGMLINLEDLYIDNNLLKEFSESICDLSNLKVLSLSENNIISIPSNINNMRGLEELFLSDNEISHIPTELCDLYENLNELVIDVNQITQLPIEIINLENLTYFQYHDNPIDNLLNPVIQRFIERFTTNVNYNDDHTVYTDSQNIHASSIQQHTKDSIQKLLEQMKESFEYDYINDSELSEKCKESLVEYSDDTTIHSQLECNFKDILTAVFYEISQLPKDVQLFAKQRLNEEMLDSECKCFTGRITRLVNSLSSISDKVIIKISDSEEIGNVITVARRKFKDIKDIKDIEGDNFEEDHIDELKEYIRKELKERGYTEEVINEWVAYIE